MYTIYFIFVIFLNMPNFDVLIQLFLVKSDYIFNFSPKLYFILLLCYQFFTILYIENGMGRGLEIFFGNFPQKYNVVHVIFAGVSFKSKPISNNFSRALYNINIIKEHIFLLLSFSKNCLNQKQGCEHPYFLQNHLLSTF